MATKLIYGSGRIPKSSEFALGDIIVNVDDSKVFSKSKSNVVFEIGASTTTTNTVESQAFTTASLHTSSFDAILTSSASPNLVISGGVGIQVTTGSQVNSIILNATGESIASVTVADTASYIQAGNIDGLVDVSSQTNFSVSDTSGQTGINLTFGSNDTLSGVASGLGTTDNVKFANITSSANISASNDLISNRLLVNDGAASTPSIVFASEPDTGIYRPAPNNLSIQVDGGSSPIVEFNFNPTGATLSTPINVQSHVTASGNISASGFISASDGAFKSVNITTNPTTTDGINYPFIVSAKEDTNINLDPGHGVGIKFKIAGGNDPLYSEEGASIAAIKENTSDTNTSTGLGFFTTLDGSNLVERLRISKDGRVGIGMTPGFFSQSLTVVGGISASGALFASMSTTDNSNFKTVVYDEDTGKFSITGSYSAGGGQTITGTDTQVLFFDNNVPVGDSGFSFNKNTDSINVTGNITSSGAVALKPGSVANEQSEISFHDNEVKIVFEKDSTAGFPFPKESINFLSDGEKLMSVGARGGSTNRVIINPDNDSGVNAFFNVRGGAFGDDNLIITSPSFNAVGMGVIPTVSATSTSGSKLMVKGNISASGFLRLAATGSGTALAGALLYSASNEFYLGFS